jgi:hypothetical protein
MTTANKIKHVGAALLLAVAAVYCGVVGRWDVGIALACASGLVGQAVIKP